MRYANVGGYRIEASPNAHGTCLCCGTETLSKCGRYVIWHWAHRSRAHCDQWWESETEWHRAWKNRFPIDWQERIFSDDFSGSKHIADVCTAHGVVIEFQRSTIEPHEVSAREQFYDRMIWVVDGLKNEFDHINFSNMRSALDEDHMVSFTWHGRSKLFQRWHTSKPVFVDFGEQHGFWRICRFDLSTKRGFALLVDRNSFVTALTNGADFTAGGGPASSP